MTRTPTAGSGPASRTPCWPRDRCATPWGELDRAEQVTRDIGSRTGRGSRLGRVRSHLAGRPRRGRGVRAGRGGGGRGRPPDHQHHRVHDDQDRRVPRAPRRGRLSSPPTRCGGPTRARAWPGAPLPGLRDPGAAADRARPAARGQVRAERRGAGQRGTRRPLVLARTEAALREAAAARPPRQPGPPAVRLDSLTPTEHSVRGPGRRGAVQSADRRAAVHFQPDRVQTHLAHVFAKLDMSARAQLAAEVTRRSGV